MLEVVAGVIGSSDGKILIAQRGPGMHFEGKWEFPGGKVENGEELVTALKREIMEELELDICVGEKIHSWAYKYDFAVVNFTAYSAQVCGGKLKTTEHMAAKWIEIKELKDYDLVPADIELAGKLCGGC